MTLFAVFSSKKGKVKKKRNAGLEALKQTGGPKYKYALWPMVMAMLHSETAHEMSFE